MLTSFFDSPAPLSLIHSEASANLRAFCVSALDAHPNESSATILYPTPTTKPCRASSLQKQRGRGKGARASSPAFAKPAATLPHPAIRNQPARADRQG